MPLRYQHRLGYLGLFDGFWTRSSTALEFYGESRSEVCGEQTP